MLFLLLCKCYKGNISFIDRILPFQEVKERNKYMGALLSSLTSSYNAHQIQQIFVGDILILRHESFIYKIVNDKTHSRVASSFTGRPSYPCHKVAYLGKSWKRPLQSKFPLKQIQYIYENELQLTLDKAKCCNGFYIQFRQTFAKETLSNDNYLKS